VPVIVVFVMITILGGCPQKILKNASSRVAKAFTDVIVNEKTA